MKLNKFILSIYFLLGLNVFIKAIDSPVIYCLNVDLNGNTTITWKPPTDTGAYFTNYEIYFGGSLNGTYTKLTTITDYNTLSFIHNGANADTKSVYYYIVNNSDGNSSSSGKIMTLFLNATSNGNMRADLDWNNIIPDEIGSSRLYHIYSKYQFGNQNLIHTTTSQSISNNVLKCSTLIQYHIETDSLGCTSNSNFKEILVQDLQVPDVPILDSVSVNIPSNNVYLGWEESNSVDVVGYVVYKNISNTWQIFDTIDGISTTSYLTTLSDSDKNVEKYRLAALDSCGNISPMCEMHTTMLLQVDFDVCDGSSSLSWSQYQGWSNIDNYEIYCKKGLTPNNPSDPYVLLSNSSRSSTTYLHQGLEDNYYYTYLIKAKNVNFKSSSNIVTIKSKLPAPADYIYLSNVTVKEKNLIGVDFLVDENANINKFEVLKSETIDGEYEVLETVYPYSYPNPPIVNIEDNAPDTENKIYYYKILVYDSCGNESINSNISRNINLYAYADTGYANVLQWNSYINWDKEVGEYLIYRKKNDDINFELINSIVATGQETLEYYDEVINFSSTLGQYQYYIEAVEKETNTYGLKNSSKSNIKDVYQNTRFFMPSAFIPESKIGLNQTVKPQFVHSDLSSYKLVIYDRMGLPVFSTSSVDEGWNGTIDGMPAPIGVYLYLCEFYNNRGIRVAKKGTITLIR